MDAIHYFLTYPRSTFDGASLHQHLESIKPIVWARVAHETHADGEPHVHAVIRFGQRHKASKDRREFDFMGRHPNVQVCRKPRDVLEYLLKEGNYEDFGPVPKEKDSHGELVSYATMGDRDAFDKCAMETRVSYQWAEHLWKRHGTPQSTIQSAGEGTECLQLQGLQYDDKSTLVVGPSGCGKSTWAKRVAPKPALWCTHLDDLKKLTKEHKSIIFDDMDFAHLPRTTQIYLVDQDDIRTIHCRHSNAIVPKGMPKIFTANNYPFTRDPAIEHRLKVCNIVSFAV